MVELYTDDFDCWQWFQEDKESVLQSLLRKSIDGHPQHRGCPNRYFKRSNHARANHKITKQSLIEILNLQPLGMFLYLMTQKEPDFFVDQVTADDDMEHVLLYTRILVTLCELQLPGFHGDLLQTVASCAPLIGHYEEIVRKLCTKGYRTMWTDVLRVDIIICHIQTLLLQAQRAGVMDEHAMQALFNIWTHLKNNGNPSVAERPVCVQFLQQLHGVFSVEEHVLSEPMPVAELYPSLDELIQWCNQNTNEDYSAPQLTTSFRSTSEYINSQRIFLRHQFLLPLRELVRTLNQDRSLKQLPVHQVAFERVQIKLNERFADAHRQQLLFADVLAEERKQAGDCELLLADSDWAAMEKLKTGALLCFTTGYDFENLILATVATLNLKQLRRGYIAITIMRQFNIGNVYGKKLLMFETPSYFEPYQRAYKYLSNSNVINFPMADYIVHGVSRTQTPAYLSRTQPPNVYESQKFVNKMRNLPLNDSQREAFHHTLKTNFNLIQGPPGTGKTFLSLQLLKTMLDHAKFCAPIVVITYTNDSLDKFLLKLSKHTDSIVRFGSQSRLPEIAKYNARADTNKHLINPRLKRLYWMVNLEFKNHFKKLQALYAVFDDTDEAYKEILATQRIVWNAQEKLNSIRMIFQHYLVVKKHVLAMTTTCASRMNFIFRFLKTKIVIFEEAAEILEAHILPCLTPYTEHIVMIGDHKQLKPYISYMKGFRQEQNQSLFERLLRARFHVNVLNVQYRMRSTMADMLCPIIYHKLDSDKTVYNFPRVRGMAMSVYFVAHREPETQLHSVFIYNDWERQKVTELVRHLLEVSGYMAKDIVVLSPYSKQVECIKLNFSKMANLSDVCVTTVDSFQGLESDIIVLSLVRSNQHGNIGFLSQQNRICVAMSRARYGLYIIGNMKNLASSSPTWRALSDKLEHQNAIGSEFPYEINH